MSAIVRTTSLYYETGTTNKSIELLGSELVRETSWGANWDQMVIGASVCIQSALPGTTGIQSNFLTIPTAGYRLGLTAGATGDLNGESSNYIGAGNQGSIDLYNYTTSGANAMFYKNSRSGYAYDSVSGALNAQASPNAIHKNFGGLCLPSTFLTAENIGMFVVLQRVTTTTIKMWLCMPPTEVNLSYVTHFSDDAFAEILAAGSIANLKSAYAAASDQNLYEYHLTNVGDYSKTITVDESTNGDFDHISLIWANPTKPLMVMAWGACKWS